MTVRSKDSFTDGSGGTVFFMEVDAVWGNQTTVNKYTGEIASIAGFNRSFDNYNAGGGFDSLAGTSGNDALIFDTTEDTENKDKDPSHYAGIDQFVMQGGDDILNLTSGVGGAVSYSESCTLVGGNGAGADILWAGGGNDTLIGENNLVSSGTAGNDRLHGGAGNDTLFGDTRTAYNAPVLGNDTIDGGTGNDTLYGDAQTFQSSSGTPFSGVRGADTFVFDGPGSGVDTIGDFEHGRDRIALALTYGLTPAQALARTADNSSGNAVIDLGNGDTITLVGVAKANLTASDFTAVRGTAGADTLFGTIGVDAFDGQGSTDTASYQYANAAVIASLTAGGTTGWAQGDTYTGIENLRGSIFADSLTGDGNANSLYGGAGTDTLSGGGGNDFLRGEGGADDMTGGLGNDRFLVDDAGDVVHEVSGQGTDTIYTTVSYSLSNSEAVEGLRAYTGVTTGLTLTGNDLANTINGGAGNDTITGGLGTDRLTGGAGNDTFVYNNTTETTTAARDVIADFVSGSDKLDLHTIDANTKLAGDQDFTFLGTGAFTRSAGQLHQVISGGSSYVEGDVDGNGTADFRIGLLNIGSVLDSGDFVF